MLLGSDPPLQAAAVVLATGGLSVPEMLDAFGPIGGHNFLWAWATGRTAGLAAVAQCVRP